MARQKRRSEGPSEGPTEAEWPKLLAMIRTFSDLDDEAFRKTVEELARDLDREGLRAHRSADRLEGLASFPRRSDVRVSDHTRRKILPHLRSKFTTRHLRLVASYLDRLVDTGLDKASQLRKQAALLLEAASEIDEQLDTFQARFDGLDQSDVGPNPSVGRDTIVLIMLDFKIPPSVMSRRLAKEGITILPNTLSNAVSRHKKRQGTS